MVNRSKEEAIAELKLLINQIPTLMGQRRDSSLHSEWVLRTLSLLDDVFGRNSLYYDSFNSLPWCKTGTIITGGLHDPDGLDISKSIERQHQEAYRQQLDTAKGILQAALGQLERTDKIESLYQGKDSPPESSQIITIINLAEHKLRKVIRNLPSTEKDIQDAFENLLIGADIPYSRESDRIEYSSKNYQPDFTFEKIGLAIEIKYCGEKSREKELISEINDDVLAYQIKYPNVLFIIYDMGFIRDIDRFSGSFERHDHIIVRIIKH
jgi:hypothetical protein